MAILESNMLKHVAEIINESTLLSTQHYFPALTGLPCFAHFFFKMKAQNRVENMT